MPNGILFWFEHLQCVSFDAYLNHLNLVVTAFGKAVGVGKKLLEYNDVVLAGTEHSNGSFEFVTWDCKNNSLDHGHYYEDYERAKEDFVKRSELLPENQIFSADERFELYRCVEDALSAGFELSSDVENILADVKEKLKDSIPDFDERLTTLDEQDQQQEQKM